MTTLSLLREKFTIREIGLDSVPVVALGNRLTIDLPGQSTPLIIRGHSMHVTLRLGAEIIRQLSYLSRIEKVETVFNWEEMWCKIVDSYEREATPETWIVLYYKGEPIYQDNYHHAFFDVIEHCEYKNKMADDKYEKSIVMAQNAFKQMDRNVMIEEESHVGFILDKSARDELRFAIILRMPGHKGTFITRVGSNKTNKSMPTDYAAMAIAANYIEAINMAVRAGFLEKSIKDNGGQSNYETSKTHAKLLKRLSTLSIAIEQAETKYRINYRPERPDFKVIMQKCVES